VSPVDDAGRLLTITVTTHERITYRVPVASDFDRQGLFDLVDMVQDGQWPSEVLEQHTYGRIVDLNGDQPLVKEN